MTVLVSTKSELLVPRSVRRRAGFKSGQEVEFNVSGGVISCLLGLSLAGLLAAQEHPSVAPGAPETAAKKLWVDLAEGKKGVVLDVRDPKEFAAGHIPEALNVPFDGGFAGKIAEMKIPKDARVVTVCDHGGRSSRAVLELEKLGYKAASFCRLDSWRKEGHTLETGQAKPIAKVYKFVCQHYCMSDISTSDLDETCACACQRPYRECMKGS